MSGNIISECINVLLKDRIATVSDVGKAEVLSQIISILKNSEFSADETGLIPELETILREHFIATDLVDLKQVFADDTHEISKLFLLLLYISLMSDSILRQKFLTSINLNRLDEFKFKYLIESIQKRGRGISRKYLDILVEEDLNGKDFCSKAHPHVPNSPTIFTSSPKSFKHQSPLKELLQSPPFQLQKLMNDKTQEIKKQQLHIYSLETDNQELHLQNDIWVKKHEKLEKKVESLLEDLKKLRTFCDDAEAQSLLVEESENKQFASLRKEVKSLRCENATLGQELREALEQNLEASSKLESLRVRFAATERERNGLSERALNLRLACSQNDAIVESQAAELNQFKSKVEELELYLHNMTKSHNKSIEESFEGIPFSMEAIANKEMFMSNVEGENLGSAVVDKMLQETLEKVESLEASNATLRAEAKDAAAEKEALLKQVESLKENLSEERRTFEARKNEMDAKEEKIVTLQEKLIVSQSELETRQQELKRDCLLEKEHLERCIEDFTRGQKEAEASFSSLKEEMNLLQERHRQENRLRLQAEEREKVLKKRLDLQRCDLEREMNAAKETATLAQAEAEKTISSLKQEVQSLREKWEQEKRGMEELEKKLTSLKNDVEKEKKAARDELIAFQAEVKTREEKLASQVKAVKRDCLLKRENMERCIEDSTRVRLEAESSFSAMRQQVRNLEERFQQGNQALLGAQREAQQTIRSLREEVRRLKVENQRLKDKAEEDREALRKREEQESEGQRTADAQKEDVERERKAAEEEVKRVREEAEKEVVALKEEIQELRERNTALSEGKSLSHLETEAEKTISSLKQEVQNLQGELQQGKEALAKSEEREEDWERKLDARNKEAENEIRVAKDAANRVASEAERTVSAVKEEIQRQEKEGILKMEEQKEVEQTLSSLKEEIRILKERKEQHEQETFARMEERETELGQKRDSEASGSQKEMSVDDVARAEREAEPTISSLQEEILRLKEKGRKDSEELIEMKTTYREEIASITQSLSRSEAIEDALQSFKLKYHHAKRKIKDTVSKLDDVIADKHKLEEQAMRYMSRMAMVTEEGDRDRKALSLLKVALDCERKKVTEAEGVVRRVSAEKRALEAQLALADSSSFRDIRRERQRRNNAVLAKPSLRSSTPLAPSQDKGSTLRSGPTQGQGSSSPHSNPKKEDGSASLTSHSNPKESAAAAPSESDKGLEECSEARSVPREMLSCFSCEDEVEAEFSNHKYLSDLEVGRCHLEPDSDRRRVSELRRRNSLYPPQLRSAYPVEMQFQPSTPFSDDQFRESHAPSPVQDLTKAASDLALSTPPAFNLRKRKSLLQSLSSLSSSNSSEEKKAKRLSTSYSQSGSPTPGRRNEGREGGRLRERGTGTGRLRGGDKENTDNKSVLSFVSTPSAEGRVSSLRSHQTPRPQRLTLSPSASSRGSPSTLALRSSRGKSPANRTIKTPSSLRRIMARAKSPWRKMHLEALDESKGEPSSSSKLRIFRRPFSGKNYDVLSASIRDKDELADESCLEYGRVLNPSMLE